MSAGTEIQTNGSGAAASRVLAGVQSTEREFTEDQLRLIKDTIAVGATNDELRLFVATARRMGLDPFARQIFAVKRWNSDLGREVMSTQVSIDGYRLVADRTGEYVPGPEPTFVTDDKGNLVSATACVMKWRHGAWHPVYATAHWKEYVQKKKSGEPTQMWASKPHLMLGKCAEALALRKAFPAELAGTHVEEEMMQADNDAGVDAPAKPTSMRDLKALNEQQAAAVVAQIPAPLPHLADALAQVPSHAVESKRDPSKHSGVLEENPDGPEPPMGALESDPKPEATATPKPENESQDTVAEWTKVADEFLIPKFAEAKARRHLQNIKNKHQDAWDSVKLHAPEAFKRVLQAWNDAGDRIDRELAAKPKSKD